MLVGDPLHHVVVVATVEMDYATSDDVSAGCGLPVGEVVGDAVDVVSGGAHGGQQSWQLHDKVQRTWPPRTVDVEPAAMVSSRTWSSGPSAVTASTTPPARSSSYGQMTGTTRTES